MDAQDIFKTVIEVSILAAIVWVFVQSMLKRQAASDTNAMKREERISGRVTQLELFVEKELITIIKNNGDALGLTSKSLQANTAALERTAEAMVRAEDIAKTAQAATTALIKRMEDNPCLLGEKGTHAKVMAVEIAEQLRTTDK